MKGKSRLRVLRRFIHLVNLNSSDLTATVLSLHADTMLQYAYDWKMECLLEKCLAYLYRYVALLYFLKKLSNAAFS